MSLRTRFREDSTQAYMHDQSSFQQAKDRPGQLLMPARSDGRQLLKLNGKPAAVILSTDYVHLIEKP
ncbi:MAG: hypothetical protein EOM22_16805 [Gammaproteobacteria bacterium]|nr:hypothetical protein [Gammaproteobacteria bacterium]